MMIEVDSEDIPKPNPRLAPMRLISARRAGDDWVVKVEMQRSPLAWILRRPRPVREFRGASTVWQHYPSGRRADTRTEGALSSLWFTLIWNEAAETS